MGVHGLGCLEDMFFCLFSEGEAGGDWHFLPLFYASYVPAYFTAFHSFSQKFKESGGDIPGLQTVSL